MREARNDGDSVLLRIHDAFSLSEAGSKFTTTHRQSPVCARFARLDWGYEKFSLLEAASTEARLSAFSEAAPTDARPSALSFLIRPKASQRSHPLTRIISAA